MNLPRIRKGAEATVMANGIPQNSSSPKLANTAIPADTTPNMATHTFVLTQSNLWKDTKNKLHN